MEDERYVSTSLGVCHFENLSQVLCWITIIDNAEISSWCLISKKREHVVTHSKYLTPRDGQELIFLRTECARYEEETVQLAYLVHNGIMPGAVIDRTQKNKY